MFIDAHNHFQDEALVPHRPSLLSALPSLGVTAMVVNGTSPDDWPEVENLASFADWIYPALGLHPWLVGNRPENWLSLLEAKLVSNNRLSLGEIGLDRWMLDRAKPNDPRLLGLRRASLDEQLKVFNQQLDLACALDRTCSIHCIDAWALLLDTLSNRQLPPSGFLLHAFSGPAEMVASFVRLGARFSFNGSYLEPRRENIRQAFSRVPLDRLLVETDAPSMLPPPECRASILRDQDERELNSPANIVGIYKGLADLLGLPLESLCSTVSDNFYTLFDRESLHRLGNSDVL